MVVGIILGSGIGLLGGIVVRITKNHLIFYLNIANLPCFL